MMFIKQPINWLSKPITLLSVHTGVLYTTANLQYWNFSAIHNHDNHAGNGFPSLASS